MKVNETHRRMDVMREFLALTKELAARKDDGDFLIEGVEKRQALMEEYVRLESVNKAFPLSAEEKAEIGLMAKEISQMDVKITKALEIHKMRAKSDLSSSNSQQKVLGYVSQGLSSSGSYMDYRK